MCLFVDDLNTNFTESKSSNVYKYCQNRENLEIIL